MSSKKESFDKSVEYTLRLSFCAAVAEARCFYFITVVQNPAGHISADNGNRKLEWFPIKNQIFQFLLLEQHVKTNNLT